MTGRFSCARHSWALEEPLLATASQVRRWVLLEQPGAWGADAVVESALPTAVGEELAGRCRQVGARPLLVRRPGGVDDGVRRCFVACSAAEGSWLERFDLDDGEQVLDLDLAPLAKDASVGGRPCDEPITLTCTNGRHDACCAEFGRGVARALDSALGDRAWECSHIGGDRFAANVLCLPEGVYYGRVSPEAAVGVARLHEAGRLSLSHYRGRSIDRFDVQAGETLLRLRLGIDRIDAVRPVARRARPDGALELDLDVDGEAWRVELEVAPDPREQRLTCGAANLGCPPRYAAREIRRLAEATG